jgi:uncharacterized repeat protein (TIGR01451 family)
MSRYLFIASVGLFAGLLMVLAFALAQRDARISHTLRVDSVPSYAEQVVSPISVHKTALEDDVSIAVPRIDVLPASATEMESPEDGAQEIIAQEVGAREPVGAEPVSYNVAQGEGNPQLQPAPRRLTEPPRFDASRIISRRAPEPSPLPGPSLLSPNLGSNLSSPPSTAAPSNNTPSNNAPLNTRSAGPKEPFSELNEISTPTPTSTPLPSSSFPSAPSTAFPSATPPSATPPSATSPSVPTPLPANPVIPESTGGRSIAESQEPTARMSPPSAPPVATFGAPRPAELASPGVSSPTFPAGPAPTSPAPINAGAKNLSSYGKGNWSMSSDSPGARMFDGSQNPSLEIIKRAPAEVQVGMPATFTAIVRNVGNSTAFDVEVFDTVPRGARLVRTVPEAEAVASGGLIWRLGELAAGQETTISMEVIPETEGELGSVASVKFAAQASVRTISTLPKLSVKQMAPGETLGGDSITIWIEVANVGTGTARDVQLEEDVPSALRHASGARSLGLEVGDLAPGESQRFEIELTAIEAAKVTNIVRATSLNAATSESAQPIEVRAPKLQLQLVGPRIRYLERPAPFEAIIENVGTAVARDLYIVAYLPRGLHFSSANNEGSYLPEQHAIAWNLAELAAGTRAKTEFMVLPVEEGKSVVRMTSDAEGLVAESIEREVQVEGQSELTFDIDDDHDPIETNGITTYSVQLTNIGTRADQNVSLRIELPDGSTVEQVNAPMRHRIQGRAVEFEAIPNLPSKERVIAKISVRHGREGTQVLRASLQSQLRPVPVIKEESTQTYVDR